MVNFQFLNKNIHIDDIHYTCIIKNYYIIWGHSCIKLIVRAT